MRNRLRIETPDGRESRAYVGTGAHGDWQTDVRKGQQREPTEGEASLWVLVDLSVEPADFYVAPEWWIQNHIHEAHEAISPGTAVAARTHGQHAPRDQHRPSSPVAWALGSPSAGRRRPRGQHFMTSSCESLADVDREWVDHGRLRT